MSALDTHTSSFQKEDLILNPSRTFFKNVYKTFANFSVKTISVSPLTSNLSFGSSIEFRIPNNGDLITKMYLNITLPSVHNNIIVGNTYANWVNSVGFALINSVEFYVGGNLIDRHTGTFLDIWNELTDKNKTEWNMVGKFNEQSELQFLQSNSTTYQIPLKFFFNRENGMALPLFILGDENIRIKIDINSLQNLILHDTANAITDVNLDSITLHVDTVKLSSEEKQLVNDIIPKESLIIETLQYNEDVQNSLSITLEHPVKEIIFAFRHNNRLSSNNPQITINPTQLKGNDIFNYDAISTTNSDDYDTFNTLSISVGNAGNTITDQAFTFNHFKKEQKHKYHNNHSSNKNIYVYSFGLYPETISPSGYYNFSRNTSDKLQLNFTGTLANMQLSVYALSYEYLNVRLDSANKSRIPFGD